MTDDEALQFQGFLLRDHPEIEPVIAKLTREGCELSHLMGRVFWCMDSRRTDLWRAAGKSPLTWSEANVPASARKRVRTLANGTLKAVARRIRTIYALPGFAPATGYRLFRSFTLDETQSALLLKLPEALELCARDLLDELKCRERQAKTPFRGADDDDAELLAYVAEKTGQPYYDHVAELITVACYVYFPLEKLSTDVLPFDGEMLRKRWERGSQL